MNDDDNASMVQCVAQQSRELALEDDAHNPLTNRLQHRLRSQVKIPEPNRLLARRPETPTYCFPPDYKSNERRTTRGRPQQRYLGVMGQRGGEVEAG